jgi:hypothetical protein
MITPAGVRLAAWPSADIDRSQHRKVLLHAAQVFLRFAVACSPGRVVLIAMVADAHRRCRCPSVISSFVLI